MSKAMPVKKKKSNSDKLWFFGGPIVLMLLLILMTGPQILNALLPRSEINARDLPSDVNLEMTFTLSVDDLDKNYFSFACAMKMGIRENSTRRLDYNIRVEPGPAFAGPMVTEASVRFENLEDQGEYVSFIEYSNGSWTSERFEKYTYDVNLSSTYVLRDSLKFPGDSYQSSVVYVWFNEPFYPEIKISPTSSLPRGFIAFLTVPELVSPDEFYMNRIVPFERLFTGKPAHDVMAFQIVIQRDSSSLWLYSIYTFIVLYASFEALVLSHFRIKELKDRLNIFVGLSIASVAFLWSIRQVTNIASWSEVVLIGMLGVSMTKEVIISCKEKRNVKATPTNRGSSEALT
jgi:hypothetical protein